MTVTMMNQRFLLLFAAASSVGATTLQQALIEDIMPPSSEHCRDIFVNGHPRPIIVNGEDMFTEVSHFGASSNEENQTWTIRLDPAGNLYSFVGPMGEIIDANSTNEKGPSFGATLPVGTGTYCQREQGACGFSSFGTTAEFDHGPEIATSLLETTDSKNKSDPFVGLDFVHYRRYRDCGNGVLEYTSLRHLNNNSASNGGESNSMMVTPFGTAGGIQSSVLKDIVFTDGDNDHEILDPIPTWKESLKGSEQIPTDTTNGYVVFAEDLLDPELLENPFEMPCNASGSCLSLTIASAGCRESTSYTDSLGNPSTKCTVERTVDLRGEYKVPLVFTGTPGPDVMVPLDSMCDEEDGETKCLELELTDDEYCRDVSEDYGYHVIKCPIKETADIRTGYDYGVKFTTMVPPPAEFVPPRDAQNVPLGGAGGQQNGDTPPITLSGPCGVVTDICSDMCTLFCPIEERQGEILDGETKTMTFRSAETQVQQSFTPPCDGNDCLKLQVRGTCVESPALTNDLGVYTVRCPIEPTIDLPDSYHGSLHFRNADTGNSLLTMLGVHHWAWQGKNIIFFPHAMDASQVSNIFPTGSTIDVSYVNTVSGAETIDVSGVHHWAKDANKMVFFPKHYNAANCFQAAVEMNNKFPVGYGIKIAYDTNDVSNYVPGPSFRASSVRHWAWKGKNLYFSPDISAQEVNSIAPRGTKFKVFYDPNPGAGGEVIAKEGVRNWSRKGTDLYFFPDISASEVATMFPPRSTIQVRYYDSGKPTEDNLALGHAYGTVHTSSNESNNLRVGGDTNRDNIYYAINNTFSDISQVDTYYTKQYFIMDRYTEMSTVGPLWANRTTQGFWPIDDPSASPAGRSISLYRNDGGIFGATVGDSTCENEGTFVCTGSTTPKPDSKALFQIRCGPSVYVGSDPYFFTPTNSTEKDPYSCDDGTDIKSGDWTLLGYFAEGECAPIGTGFVYDEQFCRLASSAPTEASSMAPTEGKSAEEDSAAPSALPTESPTQSGIWTTCPNPGSIKTLRKNPGDDVWLKTSDTLCNLWLVSSDESIKPISRSYDGNPWEAVAGHYASLIPDCNFGDGCRISLPNKTNPDDSYQLRSADHSLDDKDRVARFLERATFGANLEEISSFSSKFPSMAAWIKHQQDSIPYESHRRHYREHLNHRFELSYRQGPVSPACGSGTRFRRYAFTDKDRNRPIEIRTDAVNGRKLFYVDGQLRTYVNATQLLYGMNRNGPVSPSVEFTDGFYYMCDYPKDKDWEIWNGIGARLALRHPNVECGDVYVDGLELGIPEVNFDALTPPSNPTVSLDGHGIVVDQKYYPTDNPMQSLFIHTDLTDPNCDLIPKAIGQPVYTVVGVYQNKHWLHDPSFVSEENTIKNPKLDGGGKNVELTRSTSDEDYKVRCSNVPLNFMNEGGCTLSYEPNTCLTRDDNTDSVELDLEPGTFERIYSATSGTSYVYAAVGLRQFNEPLLYDPPCTPMASSRWIPVDSCSAHNKTMVQEKTAQIFTSLLESSVDTNAYMRDIVFPTATETCNAEDLNKTDFAVDVGGQCWLNVHQDHLSVFDFTNWVDVHPGGPLKIQQFANTSSENYNNFTLTYPWWHPMERWHGFPNPNPESHRLKLGRLGDKVDFRDLPQGFVTAEIAEEFGAVSILQGQGPQVVCGSADEVANVPQKYGSYDYLGRGAFDRNSGVNETSPNLDEQKTMTWMDLALRGEDQLRQRTAWALYQKLVVAPNNGVDDDYTEFYHNYYDIFVRNAFGNYFDILKEVSYSPMMAKMLTYLDNKSIGYNWRRYKRQDYPDENYSREIMQLFSLGLVELYNNGTQKMEDGQPKRTYSNNEITEYARLWTGFQLREKRGNFEGNTNYMDPMKIRLSYHDKLPKLGLKERYIGDGYPLCSDLPDKHFLKVGAIYQLLGSSPVPRLHEDPSKWATDTNMVYLSLDADSTLRKKLCNKANDLDTECRYEVHVELQENLQCSGEECKIQSPRIIQVEPGIYYEYKRVPCVQQAFYEGARTLRSTWYEHSCGDPRQEIARATCCKCFSDQEAARHDIFRGERVTFAEAEDRCLQHNLTLCQDPWFTLCNDLECRGTWDTWTSSSCHIKAKISLEGLVAIVHEADAELDYNPNKVRDDVRHNTKSFFRVVWDGPIEEILADYTGKCQELGCEFSEEDKYCTCKAKPNESPAFESPPGREDVLENLNIGAFKPGLYENFPSKTDFGNGVTMHSKDGEFTMDSVFEVTDNFGVTRYLKNLISIVSVGSNSSIPLTFRNPVHLMSITDSEPRDAYYEIDAGLEQYFYHLNLAPNLAHSFIQRSGSSNPSPRYIDVVATAFREGTYEDLSTGTKFGKGQYGDLAATIAAVHLDREAQSEKLDADPGHGSLLEPFLKYVKSMRSLDYKTDEDRPFLWFWSNVQEAIGQAPHQIPNVFSFYYPDYQPTGPISHANLASPESQLLTVPKTIRLMNALFSVLKYGSDYAYGGFTRGRKWNWNSAQEYRRVGEYNEFSTGHNTYSPKPESSSRQVVNELATLLTAGRLSEKRRDILVEVYDETVSRHAHKEAVINVQQLIATTPEFHSNGISSSTDVLRTLPPPAEPSSTPYKNVVFIMLEGGYDSFNLVVPETCQEKNAANMTLAEQYVQERSILAFSEGKERELQINVANQPCTTFAIHDEMTIVEKLYKEGDLAIMANVGVIDNAEGMDKTNYKRLTKTNLFAHNSMQEETKAVDPYMAFSGTGPFGRLAEVLTKKGYKTNSISIDEPSIAVNPRTGQAPDPMVVGNEGSTTFNDRPSHEVLFDAADYVYELNNVSAIGSNLFGDEFGQEFTKGIGQAEFVNDALNNATIGSAWPSSGAPSFVKRLQVISKLIDTKDKRGVDRDFFFAAQGGYDHHADMKESLRNRFEDLNQGLSLFVQELKDQDHWDDTTIIIASDFARTITANGGEGSDHAWGGHYMLMGGKVDGGKMIGKYPSDITPTGDLHVGRGRIMPTTSWESVLTGICEHMGVTTEEELDHCLPNRKKAFGAPDDIFSEAFTESDLYKNSS